MNFNYILKDKKPVECKDIMEWGKWYGDINNRIIAKTTIGKIRISTVFLGIDHNFLGNGSPILFETMIFGGELDQEMDRYCTWKEAEIGHKKMVKKVKRSK